MIARRAILVKLPKDKCDIDYIKRLMALTNLGYRNFEVFAPDLLKNIQYQLYDFKNYKDSLVFGSVPKRWFARTWIPLKTLRIYQDGSMKGDRNASVVLDFRSSIIRLRQVCKNEPGYSIELPMPKWVIERVNEGGDVRFAIIGLKDGEPYLALVAEGEVEPYTSNNYMLAIDVNAWNHGIAWGLIRDNMLIKWKPERPKLSEIESLYDLSMRLSREYGRLKRLGLHRTPRGRKLRREIKRLRRKTYTKLRDYVQKLVHRLVRKALKHRAFVIIDNMIEESRRELLEDGLSSGLRKLYLVYTRRFVKLLITQLEWYGIPYRLKRLPSTVCPVCEHELTQEDGRVMVCTNCGFKSPRDKVPMYWAIRTL
jgi:putative transposase